MEQGWKQETSEGATSDVQARDDGDVDQGGNSGGGEKWERMYFEDRADRVF